MGQNHRLRRFLAALALLLAPGTAMAQAAPEFPGLRGIGPLQAYIGFIGRSAAIAECGFTEAYAAELMAGRIQRGADLGHGRLYRQQRGLRRGGACRRYRARRRRHHRLLRPGAAELPWRGATASSRTITALGRRASACSTAGRRRRRRTTRASRSPSRGRDHAAVRSQTATSTRTGTWSEARSHPRADLRMVWDRSPGAKSGLTQTWSSRRPRSAASQSRAR